MSTDNNGLEIVNASPDAAPRLRTPRHELRDERGRFARPLQHRRPVLIRAGGYDSVIGNRPEGWLPPTEVVHHDRPDHSGSPALSTLLDDGSYPHHLRRRA